MVSDRPGAEPMVWWSMVSALLVYAGIVLFALPAPPAARDLTLPAVLAGLGVAQALAAQVLWPRVRRGAFAGRADAGGTPLPMPIVVWALDESAGVLGLVVAFLGAPQTWSLALFGVALVALLLNPYWVLEAQDE